MHYLSEQNIFLFLIQVFLLLGLARGLGEVFRRWKQPTLTAEILVGLLLGPTVLGRFFPSFQKMIFPEDPIQQNMLQTVAWLGVLFLLLESGLEVDFSSAWRQKGDALKIAVLGILIPFGLVFVSCFMLPQKYFIDSHSKIIFFLFMATVMSITAMPITTRTLHDLSLSKTDLGFLIMSALSVNDILGWLIFTLVLVFFAPGAVIFSKLFILLALILGFIIFCLTIGRKLTEMVISKIKSEQMPEPSTSLTFICLLGLFCGAVSQRIGIHALLGFLIAGIMAGSAKALSERTRHIISQMVFAIFVPLFFASIGLNIDFFKNFDFALVLFVLVLSIAGKFLGAWIGTLFTQQSKANRVSIAIAHTPGGMMEIVVGLLALENQLITETIFVAIVFGAIFSSVLVGPWLNASIRRRKEISILEYFSERTVIAILQSIEKEETIAELCELASMQGAMPSGEDLARAVLNRENSMGTAIEEGVALPHARFPFIKRPLVVFGRSIAGIEWDSPDGKPAQFIFLILTSKDDDGVQIQVLRAIAKIMSKESIREHIINAENTQGIWSIFQEAFTAEHIQRK